MDDEEEDEGGCAMCGNPFENGSNGHVVPEEGSHPVTHWRQLVSEAICTDSGALVCDICWDYGKEIAKRWFVEGVGR